MNTRDKYYVKGEHGWMHRSPLKLIVNPVLRRLQFWTDRPYVIASLTDFIDGKPQFMKYSIVRVRYLKS